MVRRIWKFLKDDVQNRLRDAEDGLKRLQDGFDLVLADFFNEDSVYYRLLQENKPELLAVIQEFLAACGTRKSKGVEFIKNAKSEVLPPLPGNGVEGIEEIVLAISKKRDDLLKKNPAAEISKLEKALMLYRHQLILKEIKKDVVVYVALLAWASEASKRIGNTNHITRKHDALFEEVVTEGYVEQFNGLLDELDPRINVKIDTLPRKGATYKQIVLEKCVATVPDATPDRILSEGEKRAVSCDATGEVKARQVVQHFFA